MRRSCWLLVILDPGKMRENVHGHISCRGHHTMAESAIVVHFAREGIEESGDSRHNVLAGEIPEGLLRWGGPQRRSRFPEPGRITAEGPAVREIISCHVTRSIRDGQI